VINYPVQGMEKALETIKAQLSSKPTLKLLQKMVNALHQGAGKLSGGKAIFQIPSFTASSDPKKAPSVEKSAIVKETLASGINYCEKADHPECKDGSEQATTAFDQVLAKAIQETKLPTCSFGDTIRVVLTATLNPNAKDGNCKTIKQFKHAKRYGGAACKKCKVYLTGGVHQKSGIIDRKVDLALSNWEPNKIEMYDDGTRGDLAAGDGIWTRVFEFPAPKATGKVCKQNADCSEKNSICLSGKCVLPLRIGYKYTYGLNGDVWGGTEEFPGNQRILEIVDHNGDGFVSRHDNFADETTNKDKVNTLQKKGATGTVCYAEPPKSSCPKDPDCGCKQDQNNDGIPDARENLVDWDHNCKANGFRVHANTQPLIKQCQ